MEFTGAEADFYDFGLKIITLGLIRTLRKKVSRLVPKHGKILDVGCGTGSQLIEIKKENPELECIGADISEDMLKIARKKSKKANLKIKFIRKRMSEMEFKKNSFDSVIATLALHEVSREEREKAVKTIFKVLKPNSSLIIMDFYKAKGIMRIIQRMIFRKFEEHAEEFIHSRENLFNKFNFRKVYSKKSFGMISIEVWEKRFEGNVIRGIKHMSRKPLPNL